jgi:hypothetical protein
LKLSKIDPEIAVAQEFHISVTPLGEDEYLVRIERQADGVPLAEEQVHWPVEEWLAQARQLMNDPLLGVLQGDGGLTQDVFFLSEWDEPANPAARNLVELGYNLYNALFQGSLRDSWMMAQAIAQHQRQVLRLRLGLKGSRLPRLPWEVLHAGDRPLATGTDVAFSRYQPSTRLWSPRQAFSLPPNQPLKILMVISSPSDQETLELAQEANHLKEELRNRTSYGTPAIQLNILRQPGREQLTQALEQGQYQVFHYAGHSNLSESGGDVYLVSNKTGLTETLNGDDLAGLLVNNGVQLAVFNSCRGAYTATSGAVENGKDRNLAEALVKRGIPAVLAMAEKIPDDVALTLTRLFYRNLNQGYPIDLSLSRARQGLISAYGSNQLYWALPVLYLHPEFNGFLTNDTPENREELFALPDPPDTPLTTNAQEVVFTRSVTPSMPPEDETISINPEDSDTDDPSAFIKDLLSQLSSESPSSDAVALTGDAEGQPRIIDNQPRLQAQPASWQLPAEPPDNPVAGESVNPQAEISQASVTQAETPAHSSPSPQRRTRIRGPLWWQRMPLIPKVWAILGVFGILSVSVWTVGLFFQQPSSTSSRGGLTQSKPSPQAPTPSDRNVPQTQSPSELSTAETATVTNLAIEQFNQKNIIEGKKAVAALLDRGALSQAQAALEAVPKAQIDNPDISFLRGRLAWQSIQSGSKDFAVSDARRYWEVAQKEQPQSIEYLTALGFAYYAEGNYERANNAWYEALALMETAPTATPSTAQNQNLSAYAGLALGLWKDAQKQPANKRESLLSKSLKTRQYVMSTDPINFQPQNLSKNWLWTEQAIQDWQALLAVKGAM